MKSTTAMQPLLSEPIFSLGQEMDSGPGVFGWLRRSDEVAGDFGELRMRMAEDGYLYLPGFWEREKVATTRSSILHQLAALGFLKPGAAVETGTSDPENPPPAMARAHPLDQQDAAVHELLFGAETMDFYANYFGGKATHFDFTWFRTKGKGPGSDIHCDIVYMGRGSRNLLTMWTPLGDISPTMGGLTLLEGSHRKPELLNGYLDRDVDRFCTNKGEKSSGDGWNGSLSRNPEAIRQRFGSRWLTSPDFKMGDALIFGMALVHGSLDNQTDRIRLSMDTRYQLASEPIDPRWVGEQVVGHGPAAKEGMIC